MTRPKDPGEFDFQTLGRQLRRRIKDDPRALVLLREVQDRLYMGELWRMSYESQSARYRAQVDRLIPLVTEVRDGVAEVAAAAGIKFRPKLRLVEEDEEG